MDAVRILLAIFLLACFPIAADAVTFPDTGIVPSGTRKSGGSDERIAVAVDRSHFERGDATVALPSRGGTPLSARFDRIVQRPDGRWSWIATVDTTLGPQSAVITFGDGATFGYIPQGDGPALRIDTVRGTTWLSDSRHDVMPDPADSSREARATPPRSLFKPAPVPGGTIETKDFGPVPLVDVLVVYTPSLVAKLGTEADARTLAGWLEALTNQAFVDSRIPGQVRVVAAQMIDYTINSDNNSALDDIFLPSTLPVKTAVDTLRAQYGADLVVMLRDYDATRGSNCGVAEMNGYHGKPFVATDGFAVVNYGSDGSQGCSPVTFAHELGHNFGSHHDYQTAGGGYGAWLYSRGHKETVGSNGFGTIMSYPSAPQTYVNLYSNPVLNDCLYRPCGIADYADNRRTFGQSLPLIAAYLPTKVAASTPTLSVADMQWGEVDPAAPHCVDQPHGCALEFRVTLSTATPYDVTFDIATADGTARAGEDYVANSVTGLLIPAGKKEAIFYVGGLDDGIVEDVETFHIVISNVRRAQLGDGEAVVTIIRDFQDVVTSATHFAGGHWSQSYADYPADKGDGGPATDAWFWNFGPLAAAADGTVYIADKNNQIIRRVAPDGIVTTFAPEGVAGYVSWQALDTDSAGNLYAVDGNYTATVWRFTPAGALTKVAGNGVRGWSGDGGPATAAGLEEPWCIAVAPDGRVVIGDKTRLREIGTDGIIRTIAGTGTYGTSGDDGPASAAEVHLDYGCELGFDDAGNLFLGQQDRIRRIGTDGIISLFAGGMVGPPPTFEWGEMVPATQTQVGGHTMAVDRMGGVMVYDNTYGLRRITPDGFIDPFGYRYSLDGQPVVNQYVSAMAFGPGGALYLLNDNLAAIVWRLAYPEVPSAPASIAAVAGNARASLTFPASIDPGGDAVTAYETESIPAGGIDAAAGTTALARDVTGLVNGTKYRFRVRGRNEYGVGPWSKASNAVTPSTTGTPTITVADAIVVEGQSGTTTLQFAVSLSAPAPAAGVGFGITTIDGSAKAGSDYVARALSGQKIAAGQTGATFAVSVTGEVTPENDEQFKVRLKTVTGASVGRAEAFGTIRNDDTAIAVQDLAFVEGESGVSTAEVEILLSRPSALPVTFTATTANAAAIAGDDYLARNTVARVIAPGTTRVTVPVQVIGERIAEPDEDFTVALSAVTGAKVADGTATVTIVNDDAVISLAGAVRLEGDTTQNVPLELTLSTPAPLGGVSFRLATRDGSAKAGSDFDAIAQTVVIPTDASSATLYLVVRGDATLEGDEEFTVEIDQVTGTYSAPMSVRFALMDDDFPDDATIDTVAGKVELYVEQGPIEGKPAVDVMINGLGAVAGTANGRMLFTQGSVVWSVDADGIAHRYAGTGVTGFSGDGGPALSAQLGTVGDIAVDAADRVYLVDANNNRIRVITSDGKIATIAGNGSAVPSGDGGAATAAGLGWIAQLAAAPDGTLYFVEYQDDSPQRWALRRIGKDGVISTVVGGGATTVPAGADEFVGVDARIQDQPALFGVRDGALLFTLYNSYSTMLFRLDPDGVARHIAGDPAGPNLNGNPAIATIAQFGGNGGGVVDSSGAVYFSYAHLIYRLSPGGVIERIAGSSFNSGFSGDGGLAIDALMDGPLDIAFDGLGRLLVVDRNNYRIRRIGGLTALPSAPQAVVASAGNASATVTFQAPASAGTSPVTGYEVYSTPAGGIDPGGMSLSRTITGLQNETAYTFRVRAKSALGAGALSAPSAPVTPSSVPPPSLSIANVAVSEGDSGTKTATFTVLLSKAATTAVSYSIATGNGTATAGSDYVARSLSAQTIAAGASSATFAVTVNGDTVVEANETYTVSVSSVQGATVADGTATGTITNDDTLPTLSIADVAVDEGNGGTNVARFTVLLSKAATSPVTFSIATANLTASAGSDYAARSLTAQTIAAGSSSARFDVAVNGDTAVEADETFRVAASAVAGATVTDGEATGTIRNDDVAALPPLATRDDRVVLGENTPARNVSVLANDVFDATRLAGGSLAVTSVSSGGGTATVQTQGTTTAADDVLVYTAPANRSGEATIGYRLCEGSAGRCVDGRLLAVLRPAVDADVDTTLDAGFADVAASRLRALPAATFLASALVAPTVAKPVLALDATPWTPWDAGRAGTAVVARSIAAAADGQPRTWRVLVDATGVDDVDLYLGTDANGDGLPVFAETRCTAAMSTVAERCELTLQHPGSGTLRYWVMVHNRRAAAQTAKLEIFEVADAAGNGRMTATGPGSLPAAAAFPVRVAWNDTSMARGGARAGYVRVHSNGVLVGAFPVRIDRAASAPSTARALGVAPLVLTLAPGEAQDRLFIDVPQGASALTVTTASAQNVDLYLARAVSPSAAVSTIPAAPARSQSQASAVGATGNESLTVSGATLTPGRWYVTPTNPGTSVATVTVRATIAGAGPQLRFGSFFNASRSGHGVFVYPAGGVWAALWYTYLQDGTPTWYYIQGDQPGANGVFEGGLYRAAWQGTSNHQLEVGRVRITPASQDDFQFTYTLDGQSGSEPMTSLGRGCPMQDGAPLDVSSHWFNPARSGTGYSVQLWPNYEYYAAFVYDGWGVPRFLTAENTSYGGADATVDVEQLTGFCPLCNRTGNPSRAAIGLFSRRFAGGTIANLTVDAVYIGGVPGAWEGNESVQVLGGPGTTQGCEE